MAVISLLLASVATWPRAIPSSLAQARTMWRVPSPLAPWCDPRQDLPSIATRPRGHVGVDRNGVGDPGLEAALEGVGSEHHEETADAVARGNTFGQGEVQ